MSVNRVQFFKLAPAEKRHRQRITLNMKLDVLRRYESGIRPVEIGRALNLPSTTVRSIVKGSEKIKQFSRLETPLNAVRLSNRSGIMVDMERLLLAWIDHTRELGMRHTLLSIQEKARCLFEDLKTQAYKSENIEPFRASRGWFERFKKRANLNNLSSSISENPDELDTTSADGIEASSTDNTEVGDFYYNEIKVDHTVTENDSVTLNEIIEDGGYLPQQVFNVDETGLFWKRMPSRTHISREELSTTGYKESKDRVSLLLGGNASGDFKLKPLLVYHSETPRVLKGYSKNKLSVIWRSNKDAWVNQTVFEDWFTSYFCPVVKDYCTENNLANKALLIIDTSPGHPTALDDLSDNVKVILLPANTNKLLQPMNNRIISIFKAYYHRRIFTQALKVIEHDKTLEVFWKNYNILKAIDNIFAAWNEINFSTMNNAWKGLWPHCLQDFSGFDESVEAICQNIAETARQIGLTEIETEDIEELIASHKEELSNEELREMEQQRMLIERENIENVEQPTKSLSHKSLGDALKKIEEAMAIFEQDDPDRQRSCTVNNAIDNSIHCYREMYREKKKACTQLSLDQFLKTTIKEESF